MADVEAWVLLVEPNRDDELIFVRSWRAAGLAGRVVVAHSDAEALDSIRHPPNGRGPPGLVLLDVDPRGAEGFGLLVRLRAMDPDNRMPIVAFSNSIEDEVVAEAYRLGARSYVRKPIDNEDVVETLRVLGRHWLEMRVAAPPAMAHPVAPSG